MNALLRAVTGLRLTFDLAVERYSAWLPVGVVAFALAALALNAAANAVHKQIASQREAVARLQAATRAKEGPAEPKPIESASSDLWDVLPSAQQQNDDLKTLFHLARRRGLMVAQTEYGRPTDGAASIDGLQLTLPLSGSYPQLRLFADDALRAMPHLSIDHIGFERDVAGNAKVEARIKLTFWYRAGSALPRAGAGVRGSGPEPRP